MKNKTIYKKHNTTIYRKPRLNHQIRVSQVRLIDENNKNVGVVETGNALKMAHEKGLDLIEIAPNIQPPVCRLMDYGKYQYKQSQQEKSQKGKQKKTETKGIRISLRISQHDLEIKVKQAEKFLKQNHKVRIEMILRGREKGLFEMARQKMQDFIKSLSLEAKIEQEIKRQPRGLSMTIAKE